MSSGEIAERQEGQGHSSAKEKHRTGYIACLVPRPRYFGAPRHSCVAGSGTFTIDFGVPSGIKIHAKILLWVFMKLHVRAPPLWLPAPFSTILTSARPSECYKTYECLKKHISEWTLFYYISKRVIIWVNVLIDAYTFIVLLVCPLKKYSYKYMASRILDIYYQPFSTIRQV